MKDIQPVNDKGKANGLWICYNNEGEPYLKRYFINGKDCGYMEYKNFSNLYIIFNT
jgi:hypothetical protein